MIARAFASVLLILGNGFFVAAEFSLVAVRRSRIEQLAEEGSRPARAVRSALRELSLMLAGAQFGITLTSLVLGAVAQPFMRELVERVLGPVDLSPWVSSIIVLGLLTLLVTVFLQMVFGEMVPKNVAISHPERVSLVVGLAFVGYVRAFRWLLRGLNGMANAGVRLFGVEPRDELVDAYTADELSVVLTESRRGGFLLDRHAEILEGALGFGDLTAAAVMVPRTSVLAIPADLPVRGVESVVQASGHSRIPVYEGDLDHVLGFVHAKDLLRLDADPDEPLPRSAVRPMWVVPESRKLAPLLSDMRRERRHFGLVVDEHGGVAGIVTLEDLLEELVGEIEDEHDLRSGRLRRDRSGVWVCEGKMRPDEIDEETGLSLPEGEYDTIAGFILDRLGAIPEAGSSVEHEGWTLRVRTMVGRRIDEVELVPPPQSGNRSADSA